MAAKALKQPSTARMAQLKAQLWELISEFEFETGELVNCIEFQGGDREGVLQNPQEIDVYLEEAQQPAPFITDQCKVVITPAGAAALKEVKGGE